MDCVVGTLLLSGVGLTDRPILHVRITSPPAPQGSHWYYRFDRATQRKCWYVRVVGQPVQQAALPATVGPVFVFSGNVAINNLTITNTARLIVAEAFRPSA